jgi:hypothetical protein
MGKGDGSNFPLKKKMPIGTVPFGKRKLTKAE